MVRTILARFSDAIEKCAEPWGDGRGMKISKIAALSAVLAVAGCGGEDPTPTSSPTYAPTPTPSPTPTGPSASGAQFGAPQKIEGIQIGIPYRGTPGNYVFDYAVEGFYASKGVLSVLPSYFPSNGTKTDVYIDEMVYSIRGVTAQKLNAVIKTSMPSDCIEIADFNKDGIIDIFIGDSGYDANPFPGGQNKLLFGSASGFIDKSENIPKKLDFTHSTASADIDKDGDIDIFVGNIAFSESMKDPYFLINDGSGSFTERNIFPAGFDSRNFTASHLADLDGDGFSELMLGGNKVSSVVMKYSNGLYTPIQYINNTDSSIITDIRAGDLNKDGKYEVVMSSTSSNPFYKGTKIDIYEYASSALINSGSYNVSENRWNDNLYIVDVNKDGFLDIVSTGFLPDTKILINNGRSFVIDKDFKAPWDSTNAAVEMWDINSDGRLDFVYTAHENPTSPSVLNMGVYVMFGS